MWGGACRATGCGWILAGAIAAVVAGCGDEPCQVTELSAGGSRLAYCSDGRIDILSADGDPVLGGGVAAIWLDATDRTGRRLASDGGDRLVEQRSDTDALGAADRLIVTRRGSGDEPDFEWTLSAYPERGFYTFRIAVVNTTAETVTLAKASPLVVDGAAGGGLYLGHDPARHRILENGSYTLLDFVAEVNPGDVDRLDAFGAMAPGDFAGNSVSNWNHAVVDLDGDAVWIAGALSFDASFPVLELGYDPALARVADDGRTGFSWFAAESAYLPVGKPLAPGQRFESERYYVHPSEPDALFGLEHYADAVAENLGLELWTHRGADRRVPNGWNSWSGSGSTGGYGTGIDESIVLANLDVMATQLRDWGMEWFQIDDGYEPYYGDWSWNPDRFPHGAAWLTAQIRDRGMKPGLWMAPFTADAESALYRDHPDWFATKTIIGNFLVDKEILDLTHPEVQDFLGDTFTTFRDDWGFEWLKMDFAYGALGGTDFHDPTRTREQAWRDALAIIRDRIGESTFFVVIGTMGMNFGLADAGRTTLDTMPVWNWEPDTRWDDHLNQQGFKPTVRTAGRRWYLQDRVWINHPDLIFFRSNPDDLSWPRITLSESRALCSFVGLSGGIVKLGDRLVDLAPEHIDTIRRLLPIYGQAARPLDVFTREYPEVWQLEVDAPLDGYQEQYQLFGLFHWGFNVDQTTEPYAELADTDQPRHHDIDLAARGLDGDYLAFEFWTQSYLGPVTDHLTVDVPSHEARVVALRPRTGEPQFLGWNRQITMGGTLLETADYDPLTEALVVRTPITAGTTEVPFTYQLWFYVPDGYTVGDVNPGYAAIADLTSTVDDHVLCIEFTAVENGELELTISF